MSLVQRIIVAVSLLAVTCTALAAEPWSPSAEDLYRLDRLPQLKPSVKVGSVSSYDRTGGNDDGFSGKYSFVRKEGDALVLADLKGPGVIWRIWTPTPSDDMFEFYFDGEAKPRITVKFRDLFTGNDASFPRPQVGSGAGGFYCYVPLPYEKSCKVLARAEKIMFYQINFATYRDDVAVQTWKPGDGTRQQASIGLRWLGDAALDSPILVLPEGSVQKVAKKVTIEPGSTATLFEAKSPGRIAGLSVKPAEALAGKDRDLVLRITWDGADKPAVLCPAGDFFGYAWGQPAMASMLLGVSRNEAYCRLPMPFDKSARIELISQRKQPVTLDAVVALSPQARQPDEGRLYALWRRENPTTKGVPFTFADVQGRGHLVGCILQSQGLESGGTPFFEGDDQTTIDGELVIHGTGSEDFFNGGWYDVPGRWDTRRSFPLSGCLAYQKPLGRTGGYRFMVTDAYAFTKSLKQTIEHGPEGNNIPTDYSATTFIYAAEPITVPELPALAARRVVDPAKVTYICGWNIPIAAFPFKDATLSKKGEKVGDADVRFLSMTAGADDFFGKPTLSVVCDLPAAGNYKVSIDTIKGPAQGHVQLTRDEAPVGKHVDLYAAERQRATVELGTLDFVEGPNTINLQVPGRHEKSTAFGLDLVSIVFERSEK